MLNNDVNNYAGNRKDLDANSNRAGGLSGSMEVGQKVGLPLGTLLLGGAVGSGLMYFLDPKIGANRRQRLVTRSKAKAHDFQHSLSDASHKFADRAKDVAGKAKSALPQSLTPNARDLSAERTHSSDLSTNTSRSYGATSGLSSGIDSKHGSYDTSYRASNDTYGTSSDNSHAAHDMPSRGGIAILTNRLPPLLKNKWVLASAALLLIPEVRNRVFTRQGLLYGSAAFVGNRFLGAKMDTGYAQGESVFTRIADRLGVIGDRLNQILGLGNAGQGADAISFVEELLVDAKVSEVFRFFSNYTNFPKFMRNVVEVSEGSDGISHWTAKGPAGINVSWDARVTDCQPDNVLAWQSLPHATVDTSGRIDFIPNASNGTIVRISFNYTPPAGKLGHTVAKVFASDVQTEMREDLGRVKSFLETGRNANDKSSLARDKGRDASLSSGLSGGLSGSSNGLGSQNDQGSFGASMDRPYIDSSRPVTGSTQSSGSRDASLPI